MSGSKRISVLLPSDVYRHFEAYCAEQGYKKSTLIARLIREHLRTHNARNERGQDAKATRSSR